MAHRRKSVRKIKETIRLHEAGFNKKQIAGSVTTSRKTVRKYIERVESLELLCRFSQIRTTHDIF